jgi:hypothetical protein
MRRTNITSGLIQKREESKGISNYKYKGKIQKEYGGYN